MRIAARRIDGYAHEVDLEGGHELIVDEPAAVGGTDTGPRPTQLLGASLAGCIAITMEMYAQRKEWDIGTVEEILAGEATVTVAERLEVP